MRSANYKYIDSGKLSIPCQNFKHFNNLDNFCMHLLCAEKCDRTK